LLGGIIGTAIGSAASTTSTVYTEQETTTETAAAAPQPTVYYYDPCPHCGGATGGAAICPYCDSSLSYTKSDTQ
jgi:hypothetical protein